MNNKKRIIKAFLIVFFIGLGTGMFLGIKVYQELFGPEGSLRGLDKTVNVLFMGIDARDTESNSRSDTMIMASIDTETEKIALVSVPRDTHIKTSTGKNEKINAVNYIEGPEAACEVVGKLLNTRVEYYVVTNFVGFKDIIDTLGGVHIDIEKDMYHSDPINPELEINIHKGYQYMDGKNALNYVRYRGGPTADIGRTQRQQKFIKAMADEMLSTSTISKLPRLIPQLSKNIKTNIPVKDLAFLARMGRDFDTTDMAAQTLPGYPYTDPASGVSYWEIDRDKARNMIKNLFEGQSFEIFESVSSRQQKSSNC